jgi:hypothetical protein
MPDEHKKQQLDISITGSVDSSLAKAIGVTEGGLAKLKEAVNTINKGSNKEAFAGFQEANQHAQPLEGSMHRIFEIAGRVTWLG